MMTWPCVAHERRQTTANAQTRSPWGLTLSWRQSDRKVWGIFRGDVQGFSGQKCSPGKLAEALSGGIFRRGMSGERAREAD